MRLNDFDSVILFKGNISKVITRDVYAIYIKRMFMIGNKKELN